MKKFFLFLTLLTLSVGQMWGDNYTISFKDNGSNSDGSTARTAVNTIVSSGDTYVSSVSNCSKVYNGKSGYGIKLGTGSATGALTITFSNSGQTQPKKIIVRACRYGSDTGNLNYKINGGTQSSKTLSTTLADYEIEMNGSTTLASLYLASSSKRIYIASVKVIDCVAPTAVTKGTVTSNSVDLTITDATDVGTYEVYYSTNSTAPNDGTNALATVNTKTPTVTGLNANTTYYLWVRSKCSNTSKSDWCALTGSTFKTAAAASFTVDWSITSGGGSLSSASGTSTTVTPSSGWRYANPAYTVLTGAADVSQSTNTFTATPTANSTIRINMEEIPSHKINFHISGGTCATSSVDVLEGATYSTMPTVTGLTPNCEYGTFVGWTQATSIANASTCPDLVTSVTMSTSDVDLYAVYSKTVGGGGPASLTKLGSTYAPAAGDNLVIVVKDGTYALFQETSGTYVNYWSFSNSAATVGADAKNYVTLESDGDDGWYLGDATNGYVYNGSSNNLIVDTDNHTSFSITWNSTGFNIEGNSRWLSCRTDVTTPNTNKYRMGGATSGTASGSALFDLYKYTAGSAGTTTYSMAANCCDPLGSINGSFNVTSKSESARAFEWANETTVADVAHYELSYKVKGAQGDPTLIANNISNSTSTYTHTANLTAGETYVYYLKAVGANNHCDATEELEVVIPQITVTGTPIAEMTYAQGDGPSSAESFVVKGKGLTDNLSVEAPTNFEVSLDNSSWGDSKTITKANAESNSGQTVYVRLKAGLLNANSPFGPSNVVISGGNAASVNVSVSGTVTSACSAPTVATPTCTSVAEGTITVSCASITVGVNCDVDEYGFVWKASSEPSISDNKTPNAGAYAANFSKALTIDGFATGTTYNIKAYGHNAAGYALSSNLAVTPRKVTFSKNGHGTQSAPATQYMVDGGKATQPSALSDDNYDFGGWYDNADWTQGDAWDFANDVVSNGDQALYAKWTPKTYSITVSGLTNVEPTYAFPSSFTYTGETTTALDRTLVVNSTNFFLPDNLTVTMGGTTLTQGTHYTYSNSTGAFAFNVAITGDIVISGTAVAKLLGITITNQPSKLAYLVGQTFDKTGAVVTATMGDGSSKAVTASAVWTPAGALSAGEDQTITATYTERGIDQTATTTVDVYSVTVTTVDAANDNEIDVDDVEANCTIASLSYNTGSTNYKFKEWYLQTASGMTISNNALTGTPSGNVVVYARFYKPISIAWKVGTGDAPAGEQTLQVQYGTQMKDLTLPTDVEDDDLEDCGTNKFMGWSANEVKGTGQSAPADLFTAASGTTEITSDKTFYAVFANVTPGSETTLLSEGFDNTVTTDDATAISSSDFSNFNGSTNRAFKGQGGIKLGSGSGAGYITSKTLNLSSAFTVSLDAKKYSNKTTDINVTVGETTKSILNKDITSDYDNFELSFEAATSTSTIKIATSAERAYIDNVVVKSVTPDVKVNYQTSCCTTLDAVSNVSVVPGRTSATVSWDKLTNASGYEYKLGEAEWATASVADANNPSISLSTLTGATSYAIQIRATGDGTTYCDKGTASAVTNFKTLSRVTAAVNDGERGAAKVSLNGEDWADYVDAADGTTIYLQATPSSASWTLGSWGASNGDVASNQLTGWTGDVTVTANFAAAELPTLATPTGMSSSAVTAISATISWNAVANASSYAISCTPSATQGDVTESAGVCSCTLTGLSAGTEYTWNVQAVGDNISYKSGAACADQNFTTVAKKPTAISITTPPTKTTYLEGDDFDATGLVVSVTYNNGESDGVYTTITPSTNLAAGTTKVTISATLNETTVSVDQAITVVKKYVLTFLNNGVEVSHKDLYEGAEYGTLPTLTAENAFDATSTTFMGWTTANIYEKQAAAPAYVTAESVMGAANVTLNAVWAAGTLDDVQVSEDFSSITAGDNTSTSGSSSALEAGDYTANLDGTNSSAVYKAGGAVKLGTSKVSGYLSTKTLSAAVGDKLEIEFDVKGWSSVEGAFSVQSSNAAFTDQAISYTSVMGGSFESKSVEVTLTVANPQIKFNSTGRVFIDNIVITKKGHTEDYITNLVSSEVTIATLTHGSTITVKNGNESVDSGDEIAAGTTLTITTNAASGYRVDNLRAYKTGDESTAVAITEGTLTMPIYGITITAEETAVYPVYVAVAAGQSTWGSVTIDGEAGPAYVNEDDNPEIVATPNAGYRFKEWTVTTSGSYNLGDKSLTDASIAPQVYAEATFTATFEEKPMTGLTLSESALTVDLASGTASLNVTGYTPSDLLDAKKTIAWSSSDETVATVSNGTITLKKAGTATITAAWTEDESVNASCALNVYQWNFTGYEVTTAPETLYSNGDQFDKSSVVIKAGYERSDNSSTKQVTLDAAEWTAKLDGSVIANNYTFALADNGKTLTLWVDETKVGEDYVLTVNAIPTDHFVINIWTSEVSPIADKTSAYSMPSISNQTAGAAATCKDHNLFVGWVEETYKDEPQGHIVAANTAMTPSNKTFYAVWGKTGNITESISYGWEAGESTTEWMINGTTVATPVHTGEKAGQFGTAGRAIKTSTNYANPKSITVYYTKNSNNKNESNYFKIQYSNGSSDDGTWNDIVSGKNFNQISNGNYEELTANLSSSTYEGKYFRVWFNGATTSGNLDDITLNYDISGAVDYITDCVQRYQITFDANGGTGSYEAIEKKEGATVTLPDGSALSRAADHYHFNGWKVYNASTEEEISVSENQFTMPGAAVNAVAQWEEDPKGTIRYVGDEIVDSPVYRYAGQTYNLRSQVTLPANKKLVGWTIDGDETLYAPGRTMTMPNPVQDITYHVQIIDQLPTPSGVSFSGGEWVLVTNSDQLNAGDFVVIVANETTNAMGAQDGNNRDVASVTKQNEGQTITITSGVATLFLQYGYREGEFALYDMAEEGYLYAVSTSANQLKTSATYTDRNYSWLITIGEGNIASIVAQGDKTHNDLKYNPNSGSPLFSCYTSGQTAVQLYRYDGHKTVEITENVNASAIYLDDADVVVKDGKTLTIDVASDLDNLTVEAGGKVSGSETLIVQDLTIKTSLGTISGDDNDGGKSGEISNSNITANGDVWIEIELTQASQASWGWYAFSVPFPVNTMNGVYYQNTPLQNEVGYAIMAYHEDERAAGNYAWKKYRETNLVPGMLYIITVGDTDYKTLRFKKAQGTDLIASTSVPVSYTTATGDGASGWNGVGNPNLQVSHQNDFTYLQFLDHDDNCFRARTAATTDLLVGTAFMVQVAEATENITIATGANEGEGNIALAPAREPKAVENTIFEVKLVNAETNRTEDNLFLTAREDAMNEYEIGRDVTKMSMGTAKCAQMYVPAYGTNLCAADFPLVNDKATYPLTINALSAGTYTISTTATENATLYLTKNGRIYWNLTMGACELDLNQGQNNEYGLVLRAEVPAVTTGIENGELLNGENGVQKVVIDEHVYILRGGEMYDMTGKMVK